MNNRVTAIFSIRSKYIKPNTITEILLCEPDNVSLRGRDKNPQRPIPESYGWFLTSVELNQPDVINTLKLTLDKANMILPRMHKLKELDLDLEVAAFLSIAPFSEKYSLFIPYKEIEFLSKIGASLDIDFFSYDEE